MSARALILCLPLLGGAYSKGRLFDSLRYIYFAKAVQTLLVKRTQYSQYSQYSQYILATKRTKYVSRKPVAQLGAGTLHC